MKVLYVGVYRDGTGWGNAALNNILALDSVGVDVVCRPIKLNDTSYEMPERILELEKKDLQGVTHVIQHVLPTMLEYKEGVKNIAYLALETTFGAPPSWVDHLNTMDAIWVPCLDNSSALSGTGLRHVPEVVPHTFDMSIFEQSHKNLINSNGRFLFYFIGEFTRRKNLPALIKAFHSEFDVGEPVDLVIKTTMPGMHPLEAQEKLRQILADIKVGLKLYPKAENYKAEILITENLNPDQYYGMHASCDCLVAPSFGEGFSIPSFEAMALGKPVIASYTGGFLDYLNDIGWYVDGMVDQCFGMFDSGVPELYTAKEYMFNINVSDLALKMREVYENKEERDKRTKLGVERAYEYAFEVIGSKMKYLLENQ